MAAELERCFDATTRLIRGGGGIFDVMLDGELVFSKFSSGRFPEPGEVEDIIRRRIG